jgi:hypothetical protein
VDTSKMSFEELCALFCYKPKNRRLSTAEAAEVLGVAVSTLEVKRTNGGGPRFFRPRGARRVFYVERDLLDYLAAGARMNTSETPEQRRSA